MISTAIVHWYHLAAVMVFVGVAVGVWRATLPLGTVVYAAGLVAAGLIVARSAPSLMPLVAMALAAFTLGCLRVVVELWDEDQALMRRLGR